MDTYYVTPENAYILIVLVLVNGTLWPNIQLRITPLLVMWKRWSKSWNIKFVRLYHSIYLKTTFILGRLGERTFYIFHVDPLASHRAHISQSISFKFGTVGPTLHIFQQPWLLIILIHFNRNELIYSCIFNRLDRSW
jgi:hypothetical protein